MMDSMDAVLSSDLGDVEGEAMSPLATPSNEVSELEQQAVALASSSMDNDEDDDDESVEANICVSSGADTGILVSTDGVHAMAASPEGGIGLFLQTSDAGGISLASSMKLSVSGMLPEGAVITTEPVQAIQAVTLADGTTAYIQQPKEGKLQAGQTVSLEDGSTAVVQGPALVPKVEPMDDFKGLEGATSFQLEDGTTAYFHPGVKGSLPEGLHAVQLEDGSMALLGDGGPLDAATLESFMSAHLGVKNQMTIEKALAIGEKAYKCVYEDCGRLYTTLHHLKVHERSHTGDRPFRCEHPSCGKAFATGYGLTSHTRVHTGEKPYPCPEDGCTKAFKTSGDLQKHVRTHTGERPFKCPFEGCDRSFTTSNIRKVHIRTHTGERPYLCTFDSCGRAFASATNYKNHVRIHTGEKPYVCTVQGCGKRFTEYSSLYKHHVVHTHSKPYTCSYCGKNYRQTSTLAMHKRTAHGEGEECTAESEERIFLEKAGEGADPPRKKQRLQLTLPNGEAPSSVADSDSTLIINTSESPQVVMLKGEEEGGVEAEASQDATAGSLVTLPGHLSLHALQGHGISGFTVGGEGGQQVFVVTDPSHLQVLQQLAQQAQQHLHSASEGLELSSGSDDPPTAAAAEATATSATLSSSSPPSSAVPVVVLHQE